MDKYKVIIESDEVRYAHGQVLDVDNYEAFINALIRQNCWPSKDGTIYKLRDMSLEHINNAILKIKREDWRLEYLPLFRAELIRRKAINADSIQKLSEESQAIKAMIKRAR